MGEEWYNNKQLFELINRLQSDFKDLSSEMRETRVIIKEYNGLRSDLHEVRDDVERMKSEKKGKETISEAIRDWGGWIVAIIVSILSFFI